MVSGSVEEVLMGHVSRSMALLMENMDAGRLLLLPIASLRAVF